MASPAAARGRLKSKSSGRNKDGQELGILLADNGFVMVLKKAAGSLVPMVEIDGVTG